MHLVINNLVIDNVVTDNLIIVKFEDNRAPMISKIQKQPQVLKFHLNGTSLPQTNLRSHDLQR